jgi:hypothetical protein
MALHLRPSPQSLLSTSRRLFSTTASSQHIKRVTLFKIPKESDIDAVLKQYEKVRETSVKDGKPYIVSNYASRIINTESPRSEGFTLSSQSVFETREDHDYYDNECPAHQELKVGFAFHSVLISGAAGGDSVMLGYAVEMSGMTTRLIV